MKSAQTGRSAPTGVTFVVPASIRDRPRAEPMRRRTRGTHRSGDLGAGAHFGSNPKERNFAPALGRGRCVRLRAGAMVWLMSAPPSENSFDVSSLPLDKLALSETESQQIRRWLSDDHYRDQRPALVEWIKKAAGDPAVTLNLRDAFCKDLPIGTGGRRGTVAPGPNRINSVTLRETVYGLYLAMKEWQAASRVVIGYDTRTHSQDFAHLSARLLAALGVEVKLLDEPRSTPQIAFLLRELGCGAGIVISASHNPPSDNGIKVYGPDGAQVLGQRDKSLTRAIVERGEEAPQYDTQTPLSALAKVELLDVAAMDRMYIDYALEQGVTQGSLAAAGPVVFTPLQGVGLHIVSEVFAKREVQLFPVPEQCDPAGGTFNATQNANPEFIEAFDRAILRGEEVEADLLLATDPDADRLGACVRKESGQGFDFIDGNRIGALLLDHIGRHLGSRCEGALVATTLVTSPLIAKIGRHYGADVVDDLLVGFKHHAALVQERSEQAYLFGCEESHGYNRGPGVRDKDAATAALLLTELVAELRSQSQSVQSRLAQLWSKYGYHRERTLNWELPGLDGSARIAAVMQSWRKQAPAEIGEFRLQSQRDRMVAGNSDSPVRNATSNVLDHLYQREDGTEARVVLRPSGTEPKLKLYVLMASPPVPESQLAATQKGIDALVDLLGEQVLAQAQAVEVPEGGPVA